MSQSSGRPASSGDSQEISQVDVPSSTALLSPGAAPQRRVHWGEDTIKYIPEDPNPPIEGRCCGVVCTIPRNPDTERSECGVSCRIDRRSCFQGLDSFVSGYLAPNSSMDFEGARFADDPNSQVVTCQPGQQETQF